MKTIFHHLDHAYEADLNLPIDLSIPLRAGDSNVTAWYVPPPRIEPVVMGDWVGEVKSGASVNFRNVFINPHGHGTHTECVGHISKEWYSLNECLTWFFFTAELITIKPEFSGDDQIIELHQIQQAVRYPGTQAIIIRTLPNDDSKCSRQYSNTNPPFLSESAAKWLADQGTDHLLLDLPSVDKEKDDGKLSAHHAFWRYPFATRKNATITEMIYVNPIVADGFYLLNLQITALENDASPSKPVLFKAVPV